MDELVTLQRVVQVAVVRVSPAITMRITHTIPRFCCFYCICVLVRLVFICVYF